MPPLMFGALCATALLVPIIGHREGIAIWLMSLIERINNWAETPTKIEKEKDE